MAERRSIHRKISSSDDLADLGQEHGGWAVAFALSLIPHYDRWGCVTANPKKLKIHVMPLHEDVTTQKVTEWVEWMVGRGMLTRVTGPTGAEGLRNPRFEEHQSGARLERESPSTYEPDEVTAAFKSARTDRPERFAAGSEYQAQRWEKEAKKNGKKPGRSKPPAAAHRQHTDRTPDTSGVVETPPETPPHTDRTPTAHHVKEGKEVKLNTSSLPSPPQRAGTAPIGGADPLPPHDIARLATHAPPGPIARRLQTLTQEHHA